MILQRAREKLNGSRYRISCDYPEEIRDARRQLGTELRRRRNQGATNVYIGFPAKLVVDGNVVSDLFPGWSRLLHFKPEGRTGDDNRNRAAPTVSIQHADTQNATAQIDRTHNAVIQNTTHNAAAAQNVAAQNSAGQNSASHNA